MTERVFLACCVLGLVGGLGCRGQEKDRPAEPVVATVGTSAITAEEYKQRLDEQAPFIRGRYTTVERKQEFLDGMIQFEVLAQEAERRGLDKDAEVQQALRKLIVQRLVKQVTEEMKPPSEAEVRQYYEEHRAEFVRPEQVRMSHIFLAAAAGDARRPQVKAEALALLAKVRAPTGAPGQDGFEALARERSDDAASKAQGGDLGPRTAEELSQAWGTALAQAAFTLQSPQEVGPLVETERGFHLLKLTLRQAGLNNPLESVKDRIATRLLSERRTQALETLVHQLRERAQIHIDEKVLAEIQPAPATSP
ncbi:peptidylprolyl isomerase [Hyalangium minutum]|uniref:Peptidyl-prolyl cis-trans isomerase PpiD n=1 Tax=Hyalangium minutum TaxID=394096 RepID=A0A085WQT3_9BACT|nr:peptidyl-prolyl cis-trans isomerase [Hyalangium minutum]KFE70046.1 Peptidyl-prolyl cis-trans isomerase PpiD [Hyalangium minutum]